MSVSNAFAQRLASGAIITEPVALVVAHSDDETLWAGGALSRLPELTLVHLTDSAPVDMRDARRLGFSNRGDYARARAGELETALEILQARPRRLAFGIPDQQAVEQVCAVATQLAASLGDVAAILTHPYEGGHPDHDAAALAVRLAVDRIAREKGRAPARVEFACYHAGAGARRFGAFWPDPACPERARPFGTGEHRLVRSALAAHRTQAAVIGGWCPEAERWRAAPDYDFAAPPPPGTCLYDGFGWAMTSTRWRAVAQREQAKWLCGS